MLACPTAASKMCCATAIQQTLARNENVDQLLSVAIFLSFGVGFVLINLTIGRFVRPFAPNPEKLSVYECGEPTIGTSWVQFDLRFYVVALFYLIFDVEVALIWPIATVYLKHTDPALIAGGIFMTLIIVGFIYEWYSGSLDWVHSAVKTGQHRGHANIPGLSGARLSNYTGSAAELSKLAKRDPETLENV